MMLNMNYYVLFLLILKFSLFVQEDRVIDEPSQEVEASQEVEEEAADPIQYLASLGNLGPLDMCLLACRMCFVEVGWCLYSIQP